MQVQDDLATLFSRNLSLHNHLYADSTPQTQVYQTTQPEEAITYSITQHYHHSAHIAKAVSKPSQTDQQTTEIILARHGVDVSTLYPAQMELFKTADASQQMRLVELWRISPPNQGGHALAQDTNWQGTSLEQEEEMAKFRYERQMMEERASRTQVTDDHLHHLDVSDDMMSDSEQSNAPITPIQGGDGRWSVPEPYMTSGYEALAQREYELSASRPSKDVYSHFGTSVGGPKYNQATDPVYQSAGNGWATRTLEEQQQAMENQYGSFADRRHYSAGMASGQDEEML
jgi:hypothetical protein